VHGTRPNKPHLLMVCHRPPPLHGAAMMGEAAVTSEHVRALFGVTAISIRVNAGLGSLQRFGFGKMWASLRLCADVARALAMRPTAMYLTVNVVGFAFWRDFVIVTLCRLARVKRVYHLHMKGLRRSYERSRLMRAAYRWVFGGADVIHLSERLYSDVAPVVPPERFHVVANGVDVAEVGASDRPKRVPTVLFLSNLYESKGPLDLLEASRCVLARGIEHNLVYAGAGAEAKVVERIRAAGPPVSWVGPVHGDRKAALLAEADVFAFPSWYHFECQPLVVIEAMASGKAIIASDEAAIPDLISDGENGLIARGRAVGQIADALARLLSDPELRAALGEAARSRYRQHYTAAHFERRLASTLWQICAPVVVHQSVQAP
jgi:glycosyltransferase involved in cell wall biosynthesis